MKRKILCGILVLTLLCSILSAAPAFAANDKKDVISPSEAKNAVVRVAATYDEGNVMQTGSAFGVGELGSVPEYFITNAHVCLDDDGKVAEKIYILLDNRAITIHENYREELYWDIDESKVVECEVVNRQNISLFPDVAVLKSKSPVNGRTCLPLLAKEDELADAAPVYALGFPGNSDYLTITSGMLESSYRILAMASDVSITSGIVSMKTNSEIYGDTDVIVHTATISSGNSGGPLIDENGTVVGINTYKHGEADANQNVSISIDNVFSILDSNNIPYVLAGQKSGIIGHFNFDIGDSNISTKTILLLCIMAVIMGTAVALVLRFRKKGKEYEESHALRLQSLCGAYEQRRFPIEDGKQLSLGRAPDNSLSFPTNTEGVSAHHCIISRKGKQLYLTDCDSSYGTFVNDTVRLNPNETVTIKVGDKISLGSDEQCFRITRKSGKV